MEPKPVEHHNAPTYPTRREMLLGTASFALAAVAGTEFLFAASQEGRVIVAHVFKHGDGRGATGCAVTSPPVFLSEEEALQILREELAKNGIDLKAGPVLKDVRIPHRLVTSEMSATQERRFRDKIVESKKHVNPLRLTAIDPKKKIAVEFVSKRRYFALGGPKESYDLDELDDPDKKTDVLDRQVRGARWSSAQSYDFKEVAEFIAAKTNKQCKDRLVLGIFYDPISKLSLKWKDLDKLTVKDEDKRCKEESTKLLRQQAQDFAAWLQKEKIIPQSKPTRQ